MSDVADQSERFTEGSLLVPLVTLAAPLVATQLLQTVYNITDTFWVGRLGPTAVSALSYAWPIVFLLISVGGGITAAGTILVSQNTGARQDTRVSHVAGQTVSFVTLLAVVVSALGYLTAPRLLALMGAAPGTPVHGMATRYTRVTFLGLWFMFGFFVFQALLRGWGDTKTPLYLTVASVALNVLVDPLFILGFDGNPLFAWTGLTGLEASLYAATGFEGMGVAGAALATVLARGLAAGVGFYLLFGGHVGLRPRLADLRPELATIRKLVRVGAPISVEQSTQALSITVMTALVAVVGDQAVAAYGIGNRFVTLLWFPLVGMGMAVETVVGQNLGAGERERARRTVALASAILVAAFVVATAVIVPLARPIAGLFVTGAGAAPVEAMAADFLRVVVPSYLFAAVFHMQNGAFHGAGATRLSMGLGVTTLWGFQAVAAAALILLGGWGVAGAWYGIAGSNVLAALAGTAAFLHGGWLGDVLEDDATTAAAGADPEAVD